MKRGLIMLATFAGALASAGCWTPAHISGDDRLSRGIVYVLPGIEGRSIWNYDIAVGLDQGGVDSAIEVYDWTIGVPSVYNLVDVNRNRRQAQRLAQRIVEHQVRYPGTPVHLVGHSAGGGVTVLVLEELPEGHRVDLAILLAPALSPTYDLTTALQHTRRGIVSFHSEYDLALLGLGTLCFGSVDRRLGVSAGAVGFRPPSDLTQAGRDLYEQRLRQVAWCESLGRCGAPGTHFGWASRPFASGPLAALIRHDEMPHVDPPTTPTSASGGARSTGARGAGTSP
jgi:pimeloyl-ACP methyl ester carboxylesterase